MPPFGTCRCIVLHLLHLGRPSVHPGALFFLCCIWWAAEGRLRYIQVHSSFFEAFGGRPKAALWYTQLQSSFFIAPGGRPKAALRYIQVHSSFFAASGGRLKAALRYIQVHSSFFEASGGRPAALGYLQVHSSSFAASGGRPKAALRYIQVHSSFFAASCWRPKAALRCSQMRISFFPELVGPPWRASTLVYIYIGGMDSGAFGSSVPKSWKLGQVLFALRIGRKLNLVFPLCMLKT